MQDDGDQGLLDQLLKDEGVGVFDDDMIKDDSAIDAGKLSRGQLHWMATLIQSGVNGMN